MSRRAIEVMCSAQVAPVEGWGFLLQTEAGREARSLVISTPKDVYSTTLAEPFIARAAGRFVTTYAYYMYMYPMYWSRTGATSDFAWLSGCCFATQGNTTSVIARVIPSLHSFLFCLVCLRHCRYQEPPSTTTERCDTGCISRISLSLPLPHTHTHTHPPHTRQSSSMFPGSYGRRHTELRRLRRQLLHHY